MRRKKRAFVSKGLEVSSSLQNHWVSSILFGFFALSAIPNAFYEPGLYSVLIALFVSLILAESIIGIIELNKFRQALESDPNALVHKSVRQPI